MTSTFIPVETILKVDEEEILVDQNNVNRNQEVNERPLQSIVPTGFISIGTQCPPLENEKTPENTEPNVMSVIDRNTNQTETHLIRENDNVNANSLQETPLLIKNWATQAEANPCHEEKLFLPAAFPQQIACNFQTYPVDEKFFLQFDYKTRNKLKTKQRRLDPFYRSQERIRQRTVMRLKRQDPRFRAVEREKGRYRMRLKRLDPIFRSQERERQRERMKVKRRDPDFREKEREQQKSRLHVKRLDPAFKEKERAQDRLRMRIKRQNNGLFSAIEPDKNKMNVGSNSCIIADSQAYFKETNELSFNSQNAEIRNGEQGAVAIAPDNISNNARLLTLKPREPTVESFHYRKAHILNFNFYNSGKEQWANHSELYKGVTHFNVLRDDGKQLLQEADNSTVLEGHILGKDSLAAQRVKPVNHSELYKGVTQFNVLREEGKPILQEADNNAVLENHLLSKDNLAAERIKQDMISHALMKIKNESPVADIQPVEKSPTLMHNHDISCVTSKLDSSVNRPQICAVSEMQSVEKSPTLIHNHDISCVTSKLDSSVNRPQIPPVTGNSLY